jgi:PilZ domain-containing protein
MVEDSAEQVRPPVAERRRQQRLPIRGTALVRIQRRELRADTVDISPHGVCLTLPRGLEVGGACQLDLEIFGAAPRCISVEARVCFCLQGKDGYRIGLNCDLEDFVEDGTR